MTDTRPKPKRRRWRWLVVMLLLFVVSILGWVYSSVHNAAFVGTWETSDHDGGAGLTLILRRSGIAELHHRSGGPSGHRQEQRMHWHAHDHELLMRPLRSARVDAVKDSILTAIATLQGQPGPFDQRMGLLSADESTLEVSFANGNVLTLRRLPE